jgi:hypothetical protein
MTVPCLRPDSPRDLSSFETRRERAMYTALVEIRALSEQYAYSPATGDVHDRSITYAELICRLHSKAREAVLAATDPVINWPRPDWYEPAHGRPVDGPGMRGDDALPCDVEKGDAS